MVVYLFMAHSGSFSNNTAIQHSNIIHYDSFSIQIIIEVNTYFLHHKPIEKISALWQLEVLQSLYSHLHPTYIPSLFKTMQ